MVGFSKGIQEFDETDLPFGVDSHEGLVRVEEELAIDMEF